MVNLTFVSWLCWAMLTSGYEPPSWEAIREVCPVEVVDDASLAAYLYSYAP